MTGVKSLNTKRPSGGRGQILLWIIAIYGFVHAISDQLSGLYNNKTYSSMILDAASGSSSKILAENEGPGLEPESLSLKKMVSTTTTELSKNEKAISNSTQKSSSFATCTISEYDLIKETLTAKVKGVRGTNGVTLPGLARCKNSDYGWLNRCPLSYITGCPKSTWLFSYYQQAFFKTDFVAVNVGCNKGYDAINFLRMGSNDDSISRTVWKEAMPADTIPGVCKQDEEGDLYQVTASQEQTPPPLRKATVLCVEPVPATFKALQAAQESTGYGQRGLKVFQYALNNYDPGYAKFPNSPEVAGAEKLGLKYCNDSSNACDSVKTTRLDALLDSEGMTGTAVDILLIDVEGWDFEVLKGSSRTLQQTSYVEFEYNWRGMWGKDKKKKPLRKAVTFMNSLDFTCYWPGRNGELWKLTGCWNNDYAGTFWANVACVNRKLAPELAGRMEHRFLSTIGMNGTASG